jgi:hypothetical protein
MPLYLQKALQNGLVCFLVVQRSSGATSSRLRRQRMTSGQSSRYDDCGVVRTVEAESVLREGKPLRKQNGMPFTLPFSRDTIRWREAAIVVLRKFGIHL